MKLPTDNAARKRLEFWTYLTEYFPDALMAEVEVAVAGNEQHNPGQRLHWAREKSTDQMNTAFRHMLDYGSGVKKDTDGQWHLAKAVWRLKAQLQLDIEAERQRMDISDCGRATGQRRVGDVVLYEGACKRPRGHEGVCAD